MANEGEVIVGVTGGIQGQLNNKQATLSGLGIVKSTSGAISYLTDNSSNWDNAYTYRLTSASGTNPLTLTLSANSLTGSIATAADNVLGVVKTSIDGGLSMISGYIVQNDSKLTSATPASNDLIAFWDVTGNAQRNMTLTTLGGLVGGSMTYPGSGIAVSTGSSWGTSLTAPSGAIVGTTDVQTLTNKTLTAPAFGTSTTYSYATATTVPYLNASKQLVSSSVTSTELGYLSGVSSAIQTQLNNKVSSQWTNTVNGINYINNTSIGTTAPDSNIKLGIRAPDGYIGLSIVSSNSIAEYIISQSPTYTSYIINNHTGSGAALRLDTPYGVGSALIASSTSGYGIETASQNNSGLFCSTSNNSAYSGQILGGKGLLATKYSLQSLNTAPSSATDTGTTGEIRVTSTYIYVCTATNTWKRVALSTW